MTPSRADVFVVTGASSGIGHACAQRLLAIGGCVAGVDLAASSIEHPRYLHVVADVRDEDTMDRAVGTAEEALGPIRGLVNAAGTFAAGKSVLDLTLREWERVIATNLTGTFVVGRAAARRMIPHGRGKIVNVACIRSRIFRAGMSEYAASKGGVAALTAAMALDLAPHGIQVNAVAPGFTWTPMTDRPFSNPEVRAASERLIPAGRIAQPDDVAGPILFLLSTDADYVTGEAVFVDGGFARSK